jgi:hypothetical protein
MFLKEIRGFNHVYANVSLGKPWFSMVLHIDVKVYPGENHGKSLLLIRLRKRPPLDVEARWSWYWNP